MNTHLKTAYTLGAQAAHWQFKQAQMAEGQMPPEANPEAGGMPPGPEAGMEGAPPPNLGDPNFWEGGTPPEGAAAGPASAEEAINLLPGGSFQGLNTRITPDGQKSTGLKVSPAALTSPDVLQQMFQSEPGVRIEITEPDTPSNVTSFREG